MPSVRGRRGEEREGKERNPVSLSTFLTWSHAHTHTHNLTTQMNNLVGPNTLIVDLTADNPTLEKTAKGSKETKGGRDPKCATWCVTLNNYTADELDLMTETFAKQSVYGIIGAEIGENGTPHLQCYVHLEKAHRMNLKDWQLLFGRRVHVEKAIGNAEHNKAYCSKDGNYTEFGDITKCDGGKEGGDKEMARWELAWEKSKSGEFEDIPKDILMRSYGTSKRIYRDFMTVPESLDYVKADPPNMWLFGAARTGKTAWAIQYAVKKYGKTIPGTNLAPYYMKSLNKWWGTYSPLQPVVIIDDFAMESGMGLSQLKIWADRNAFDGEIKGETGKFRPKEIIVTCNKSIEDALNGQDYTVFVHPILGRFKQFKFTKTVVEHDDGSFDITEPVETWNPSMLPPPEEEEKTPGTIKGFITPMAKSVKVVPGPPGAPIKRARSDAVQSDEDTSDEDEPEFFDELKNLPPPGKLTRSYSTYTQVSSSQHMAERPATPCPPDEQEIKFN